MRGTFAIAGAIAQRQHGRVTRPQLLAEEVDAKRIERWLADGRLRRVHYGVYAVGLVAPSCWATTSLRCWPVAGARTFRMALPRTCSS